MWCGSFRFGRSKAEEGVSKVTQVLPSLEGRCQLEPFFSSLFFHFSSLIFHFASLIFYITSLLFCFQCAGYLCFEQSGILVAEGSISLL
jgi:hypothetical protein